MRIEGFTALLSVSLHATPNSSRRQSKKSYPSVRIPFVARSIRFPLSSDVSADRFDSMECCSASFSRSSSAGRHNYAVVPESEAVPYIAGVPLSEHGFRVPLSGTIQVSSRGENECLYSCSLAHDIVLP